MSRNAIVDLNCALLRAFGVDPAGVTAATLTLRPKHPPRLVLTRIFVSADAMGVSQQVEALKLQVEADGECMAPVSAGAETVSMSTGEGA